MTDRKRRIKVFMESAAHKPHMLILSRFPNYQYTIANLTVMATRNEIVWCDEPDGHLEGVDTYQALTCIDVYQKWWHNLEDEIMDGESNAK
jgi:hypothetical protein